MTGARLAKGYSLLSLQPPQCDHALDFVCAEFVSGSVLHRHSGVTVDEYKAYLRLPFYAMVSQGLSFVVVDEASGRMVGCLLAGDMGISSPVQSVPPPRLLPAQALLARLEQVYHRHRSVSNGLVLLVDIAVVCPSVRGQGLYAALRHAVHASGTARGFRYVVGELTSSATQRFCIERLRHRVIGEVRFADFEYEGERPFSAIDDPPAAVLVEGDLR